MFEAAESTYVMPRLVTVMTINLYSIHTLFQEHDREPQAKGTQTSWARYKQLNTALSRFNVSLVGIQEHHLQSERGNVRVTEKLQKFLPNKWPNIANSSCTEPSGVAIAWRKDTWILVSAFSMGQCRFRVLGAVMKDMEGQKCIVFSCYLHNDPSLQKVTWTRISKLRNLFPELPMATLCDLNSILFPEWDHLQIFQRGLHVSE